MSVKNREILSQYIGDEEKLKEIEAINPERFKIALEKAHLLEETSQQLSDLKNDLNKTPQQKFDVIFATLEQVDSSDEGEENPVQNADDFRKKLSGGKFDIKTAGSWKAAITGGLAVWAFDEIQKSEQDAENPDMGWMDKIGGSVMGSIGLFILKVLGFGQAYDKFAGIESGTNQNQDEHLEVAENLKYNGIVKIYTGIAGTEETKKQSIGDVLMDPLVKQAKYSHIIDISTHPESSELFEQLINKGYSKTDISLTFKSLAQGKGYEIITDILEKSEHESAYTDYSIEELLFATAQDFKLLINIGEGGNLSEIGVNINENPELQEQYSGLGISVGLISKAVAGKFMFDETGAKNLHTQIMEENPGQDKEKLEKIIQFGFQMQSMLVSNDRLQLGTESNVNTLFAEQKLSLKEVLELYIITKGETDFEAMNAVQQSYIYFAIPGLFSSRSKYDESAAYTVAIMETVTGSTLDKSQDISEDIRNKVPDGVKTLLSDAFNGIIDKAGTSVSKFGDMLKGAFTENKTAGVMLIAASLFAPIFNVRTSVFGKIFK